jgi:hypothetical protein
VSPAALDSLGVPKKEREEIFSQWHGVNRCDYVHIILSRHSSGSRS